MQGNRLRRRIEQACGHRCAARACRLGGELLEDRSGGAAVARDLALVVAQVGWGDTALLTGPSPSSPTTCLRSGSMSRRPATESDWKTTRCMLLRAFITSLSDMTSRSDKKGLSKCKILKPAGLGCI